MDSSAVRMGALSKMAWTTSEYVLALAALVVRVLHLSALVPVDLEPYDRLKSEKVDDDEMIARVEVETWVPGQRGAPDRKLLAAEDVDFDLCKGNDEYDSDDLTEVSEGSQPEEELVEYSDNDDVLFDEDQTSTGDTAGSRYYGDKLASDNAFDLNGDDDRVPLSAVEMVHKVQQLLPVYSPMLPMLESHELPKKSFDSSTAAESASVESLKSDSSDDDDEPINEDSFDAASKHRTTTGTLSSASSSSSLDEEEALIRDKFSAPSFLPGLYGATVQFCVL